MNEFQFQCNGIQLRYKLLTLFGLTLLACCAGAWLTFFRPHPVFPAIPGTNVIAFNMTNREPGEQIYLMRADGSYPTRLTYNVSRSSNWWWFLPLPFGDMVINAAPMPAPGGRGVVFLSNIDVTGDFMIYQINIDGSGQFLLSAATKGNINVVLSPEGRRIAFIGSDRTLSIMNTDGSGNQCLTCGLIEKAGDPAWSPDGQRIAFTMGKAHQFDLYVMNADGTNLLRLTNLPDSFNDEPAWSPNGQRIAFRSNRDAGNTDIYVMNADGTGQTRLTTTTGSENYPAWSPDGQQIAFSSLRSHFAEIYLMNADGSAETQLTDGPGNKSRPSWVQIPAAQ